MKISKTFSLDDGKEQVNVTMELTSKHLEIVNESMGVPNVDFFDLSTISSYSIRNAREGAWQLQLVTNHGTHFTVPIILDRGEMMAVCEQLRNQLRPQYDDRPCLPG